MKPSDPTYRPDIDGLRAIAVSFVVLFHVGIPPFSGGYVGVDVFFVISGFLITRMIRDEVLRTGSFRFSNFYLRRARRLLPALFFTFAVCLVCGIALFTPNDLQRFCGALVHAVASLSNFYFWSEAGYFDAAANVKPLLHTWSLSVEEQFYLVWPATLVLLLTRARRFAVPILISGGLISLGLNWMFRDGDVWLLTSLWPATASWISDGAATIYYLAPFRIFEFAIGSWMVWRQERPAPRRVLAELYAIVGLAMIALSAMAYTRETLFPSVYALPPCLGTALIIRARGSAINRLLATRPLVGLGLISYSLYLIHWPIAVFYRYVSGRSLEPVESWAIFAVSIAAAALMYRTVEKPFRHRADAKPRWSPAGFGLGCAMCALALTIVSANAWGNRGWTWRYGESEAIRAFGRIDDLRIARMAEINGVLGSYFAPGKTAILVVGDSLADDLALALALNLPDEFDVQRDRYRSKCAPMLADPTSAPVDAECVGIVSSLDLSMKIPVADWILITYHLPAQYDPNGLTPLLDYLRRRARPEAHMVLIGRGPEFVGFQRVAVSMLSAGESTDSVERRARDFVADSGALDREMRDAAARLGLGFLSKTDSLCSAERCRFFTDGGGLMFWDDYHLTVDGARWWGARIAGALGFEAVPADELAAREQQARARPSPLSAEVGAIDLSLGEAAEIVGSFGYALSAHTLDGSALYDQSALEHPKNRIRAAILEMMTHVGDAEREGLKNACLALAFFQAGVEDGQGLDTLRDDGTPWRKTVEAEMGDTMTLMIERGF